MRLTTALLLALGALAGNATYASAQCDGCVFPGESWEVLRGPELASADWDAEVLRELNVFLQIGRAHV